MSSESRGDDQIGWGSFLDGLPSIVAAAHELKSPLALIRQLSLSLEGDSSLSLQQRQRILQQITLSSERALRLTGDLTKSVRLRDALFELEPINPMAVCEDVVHELQPMFNAKNKTISLVSRKHSLLIVGNRDLLRRVLLNFSDNALHYADDNSSVKITISSLRNGQVVRLGVRDFGPALSADVLRSLGRKFLSSPESIHARPQSSGLGIYIAGQFAEAMNGEVGVIKHRDGATFYVDLQSSHQLSLL
jgi:signal transduction histidine kinase